MQKMKKVKNCGNLTLKKNTYEELSFELGVPFEEISTDGRKCKTIITMEGGSTLVTDQVATEIGNKSVKAIRDFTEEGMYVQMICEDVISRQFFRRQ